MLLPLSFLLTLVALSPTVALVPVFSGKTTGLQGTFLDRLRGFFTEASSELPSFTSIGRPKEAFTQGVEFVEREVNAIGGQINANIDLIHDTDHGVRICNAENELETGVCFSRNKCKILGGRATGKGCRIFTPKTTCCLFERTCGGRSEQTVTYFSGDQDDEGDCTLDLGARLGACQLKIEFTEFQLPPPDAETGLCSEEGSMEVVTEEGDRVLLLCGVNTGNHLYLPLEPEQKLEFRVRPSMDKSLPYVFKLKVMQVDCRSGVAEMRALRAPDGCLQYFSEPAGAIASLNFDFTSPIAPGQDYSICFRSTPDICLLRLKFADFDLPKRQRCRSSYVSVPGATSFASGEDLGKDRFCGSEVGSDGRVITAQKPFVVRVRVDENLKGKTGFLSLYELTKCEETP